MTKNIYISSDHGGYDLKGKIINYFQEKKLLIRDLGPNCNKSVDYPDFCKKLVGEMKNKDKSFGILVCGTGIGMSMAANRYNHIRAALCTNENMASLSRKHNDANVLVLGGRTTKFKDAKKMINVFLETKFEFGRHISRIEKI